jgi:hypothetical protein
MRQQQTLRVLVSVFAVASLSGAMGWRQTPPSRAQNNTPVPTFAVRLTLGARDDAPTDWSGRVVASEGRVTGIEGVRFDLQDELQGTNGWKCSTREGVVGTFPLNLPSGEPTFQPQMATQPNGVILYGTGAPQTRLKVETAQGTFEVVPDNLIYGRPRGLLNAQARAERVPVPQPVSANDEYHDYPALTTDNAGNVWVSWVAYAQEKDRVMLRKFDGGQWSEPVQVSPTVGDYFQTAIAATPRGVQVCYARREGSNWDIFTRSYDGAKFSAEARLTRDVGPDMFPRLASDKLGKLYLAWQGFRNGQSDVFLKIFGGKRWSQDIRISDSAANDWQPAMATDNKGAVYVAWDTYAKGNYDICLRTYANGKLSPIIWVANSPQFEAHPSLAFDGRDGVWVAWDESGAQWGKDYGFLLMQEGKPQGTRLYQSRAMRLALVRGGKTYEAAEGLMSALPKPLQQFSELPHLSVDEMGRLWVFFRHRTAKRPRVDGWAAQGSWELYATALHQDRWIAPIYVPQSSGRNDSRCATALDPSGKLWLAWVTDGRTFRQPFPRLMSQVLCTNFDLRKDAISAPPLTAMMPNDPEHQGLGVGGQGMGNASSPTPNSPPPTPNHPNESADIARIRNYRLTLNGKSFRILRGDLHRHTDISGDGVGDGSLLDLYRYALDAAKLDFILVGDHNAGNNQEYSWWRTQKSNDLFFVPNGFVPMYGYERSAPYPNGHRNLIFTQRGVRALPIAQGEGGANPTVDTGGVLYPHLRQNNGIATSHTSATDQGTDWRDNDPNLEPIVELFQGYHTSYEHAGAPKTVDEKTALVHGRYRPAGFVWKALEKGLRLGFQASSDHISTHLSYACVYVDDFSRQGLMDAMKKRHTYAATDNVILDVRMGDAMMGDEITLSKLPPLTIKIVGTAPIAQVDIIKDNQYVYTRKPNQREVTLTYLDNNPKPGASYYYVRVLQTDGQMAWASPLWVTWKP